MADFTQAAQNLGIVRRQTELRDLFLSLTRSESDKIDFSVFASIFAREKKEITEKTRRAPHQMGIFVNYSKAPPAKLCEFIEDERRKNSPKRLRDLPSDVNPEHMYGRPAAEREHMQELLAHSFAAPGTGRKVPGRTIRLKPLSKVPI